MSKTTSDRVLKSSRGPRVPNYLRPTAASQAKRTKCQENKPPRNPIASGSIRRLPKSKPPVRPKRGANEEEFNKYYSELAEYRSVEVGRKEARKAVMPKGRAMAERARDVVKGNFKHGDSPAALPGTQKGIHYPSGIISEGGVSNTESIRTTPSLVFADSFPEEQLLPVVPPQTIPRPPQPESENSGGKQPRPISPISCSELMDQFEDELDTPNNGTIKTNSTKIDERFYAGKHIIPPAGVDAMAYQAYLLAFYTRHPPSSKEQYAAEMESYKAAMSGERKKVERKQRGARPYYEDVDIDVPVKVKVKFTNPFKRERDNEDEFNECYGRKRKRYRSEVEERSPSPISGKKMVFAKRSKQ